MKTETHSSLGQGSRQRLRRRRELVRLNVDQNQPINIFQVIEQAGIWLFFQPLKDLQGVYLKEAKTGARAILINSRRPLSMQRLTAAHEYGHDVLGHEASLDDAADVEPSDTQVTQEAAAQTFANDFLMPPQLVNTQWNSLGLPCAAAALGAAPGLPALALPGRQLPGADLPARRPEADRLAHGETAGQDTSRARSNS